MKKKSLFTFLALVCALCCAFSLAACGGDDDDNVNPLTSEQWKSVFAAAQSEKNFRVYEDYIDGNERTAGLIFFSYSDSANVYYRLQSNSATKMLVKKADRYYVGEHTTGYYMTELNPTQYSQAETVLLKDVAPLYVILKGIEDGYTDFEYKGGGVTNTTFLYNYETSNFSFTVGDNEYTAQTVTVEIEQETKTLISLVVDIEIEKDGKTIIDRLSYGAKSEPFYEAQFQSFTFSSISLPEFIGKTFKLYDATVNNTDYAQYIIGSRDDGTFVVDVNEGKTATFNADGTISGDIVTSQTTTISDFKYTDEYGVITVTNEDNVSDPNDVVTLSGRMVTAPGATPKLVLTMQVQIGGVQVTATFTYLYVSAG